MRTIFPTIGRFAMPVGFLLGLGLVFVPSGGCGGVHPVAEIPGDLAAPIRACAVQHERHVEGSDHKVTFDVGLVNGRVDSIALVESTLNDEELETCLASKIRSFTVDDLPLRPSANLERDLSQPQSRELLGNPAVPLAACLATPPCLLGLVVVMGATVITVQLIVYSATATATATATPASTATPAPTTTATATPTATATTTTTSPPIPSNRDRWQWTASCNVQQINQKVDCPPPRYRKRRRTERTRSLCRGQANCYPIDAHGVLPSTLPMPLYQKVRMSICCLKRWLKCST